MRQHGNTVPGIWTQAWRCGFIWCTHLTLLAWWLLKVVKTLDCPGGTVKLMRKDLGRGNNLKTDGPL